MSLIIIYESHHIMNIIKAREEYYGNPSCFLSSRILELMTADRDKASVGPGVGGRCPSVGSSWRTKPGLSVKFVGGGGGGGGGSLV